jgi:Ser/Thr protein kinase RdoA (MazF antagonist)
MGDSSIEPAVAELLSRAGLGKADFQMQPLSASGNNRVFIVHSDNEKMALKWYFNDAADMRDRLGAEYAFLEHAWRIGLRCIPRPIAKDLSENLALYEFVEGQKIDALRVDEDLLQQAASFLAALNSPESRAAGSGLSTASEACFSVADHFLMVDSRVTKLESMPVESAVEERALELVMQMKEFGRKQKRIC